MLQICTVFKLKLQKDMVDDLKKVLLRAGKEGKSIVFLFTDSQIVKESFLEDINNILNSGEVPNIWDLVSFTAKCESSTIRR